MAPKIRGIVATWRVRRQPSLSTNEPQLMLPKNAPAINMLTTSPSRIEFPSKPSSCAIETIGPFITLHHTDNRIKKILEPKKNKFYLKSNPSSHAKDKIGSNRG